jgi:riboflavin kinase / FMN adenylyltransferase
VSTVFINGIDNYVPPEGKGVVATVGTFDGIHRGHQAIFSRVREISRTENLDAVLVTFDPHPKEVVSPDHAPKLLTSPEEKKQFIPCYFNGTVIIVNFTVGVMNLTASEFVNKYLVEKLHIKKLVVGHDHAIGKNRGGHIDELQSLGAKYGFEVEVVGPVMIDNQPVSSSRIRTLMSTEFYHEAVRLLGHEYAIFGTVERGIGLGRKLGYPTANVKYNINKQLPQHGVYSCYVQLGEENLTGMMFIGTNYYNPSGRVTVETNIFDFDRDIYDRELIVYPTKFIRSNRRFEATAELIQQLAKDKNNVLEIISQGEQKCL